MLSKKERLSKREFDRFFSSGRRVHSRLFTLVYTPHQEFHASVVVPKKLEKSAVKRNTFRRRVYDILRRERPQGVYIVLAKKAALTASYDQLNTDLTALIGNISDSR